MVLYKQGLFSALSYAVALGSAQDGGPRPLPKVQNWATQKNQDFERNWSNPQTFNLRMCIIWKQKNMCLPWVKNGIFVKNKKKWNTAKWIFRKAKNDPEVEPDAWPKNPKSREVFRGQRRGRPRAKVWKKHFSTETAYFWNHKKGVWKSVPPKL